MLLFDSNTDRERVMGAQPFLYYEYASTLEHHEERANR
jgi:hypothetical protein